MRKKLPLLLALCSALMLGACNDGSGRVPLSVATRDSAVVEIADVSGDPWTAPEWATIDTSRVFRILPDAANPATLFSRIRGALKLRDGTIAVLDAGSHQVRVFGTDGRFIRSFGRQGQGPGEFQQPWRLLRGRGDSLVIAELMSGTIQVFSPSGDSARPVRVPYGSKTGTAHLLGTFADGDYLVIMNDLMREPQVGRNPLHSSLHVMTALGDSGVALGKQISTEQVFKDAGGGKLAQVDNLFWAEPGWAGLSDSYVWCLPREFECDVWSKSGRQTRIIRANARGAPIASGAYTELEAQGLRTATTERDSALVRRTIAEGDRPQFFPILSLIRGDRKDRVWMREFLWRADATTARWLVFETTGKILGTVTLPADLWVFDIGEDYILGTDLDENDVQRVVMYGFTSRE